jgi:hypothetical protein
VALINLFTVVFFALPIYGAYTSVQTGYSRAIPSWVMSAVFTVAWFLIAAGGGWLFTLDQQQSADGWGFPVYYAAMAVAVVAFMVGLYAVSTARGRLQLRRGSWIVAVFLLTLLVSYLGQFGPMDDPALGGQSDLVVMTLVAIGTFIWAVASGGPTEELDQVVAHQSRAADAEGLPNIAV